MVPELDSVSVSADNNVNGFVRLVYLNTRCLSLHAKFPEFKQLIDGKFCILALSETWLYDLNSH